MKKITVFFMMAIFLASSFNAFAEWVEVKKWDLRTYSTETWANLAADPTNWTAVAANPIVRYNSAVTMSGTLKANNIVIAETDGITFPALNSGNFSFRNNNGLQLGSTNKVITIPNRSKGEKVEVTISSTNSTDARGFSGVMNMLPLEDIEYTIGNRTYPFVVMEDGDILLNYNAGIILKEIVISEEENAGGGDDGGSNNDFVFGDYHITENFDGLTALPSGWSCEQFGTAATCSGGKLSFQGSGNGHRGNSVSFPNSGDSEMVYVEFDFSLGTSPLINTGSALFLSITANTTMNRDRIFELYFHTDGKIHLSNLDLANLALTGSGTSNGNYNLNLANAANTVTSVSYDRTSTYKIKAFLDFVNHKILRIYVDDTKIGENLSFISSDANNAGKIALINARASGNANLTSCTLDNFEIGHLLSGWEEESCEPETIYILNEPFDDVTGDWGFTIAGNNVISIANVGGTYGNALVCTQPGNQSGKRTNFKTDINWTTATPDMDTDGYVYMEFDWYNGTPSSANGSGFIRFLTGANDADAVLTIGTQGGNNGVIVFGNLDAANQVSHNVSSTRITPSTGSFVRNAWYHIYACLDFTTKKVVNFKISNEAGDTYEASNIDFINKSATAITRMEIINGRFGGDAHWPETRIDNMQVYYTTSCGLTYNAFMQYVETVQASCDAETATAAYITAIKATLQDAIDAAKILVNASSTEEELEAAKEILDAALLAFEAAKTHYTALQTSIASVTTRHTAVALRVGTEFLNYTQAAVTILNDAIVTANTTLSTAATSDALDAAKTAIDNALVTFNNTGRVEPLAVPYRIFSYGAGDNYSTGNSKNVLYSNNADKLAFKAGEAENDMWLIAQTSAGLYTMKNVATGLYVNLNSSGYNVLSLTGNPVEFSVRDGEFRDLSIVVEEPYFMYAILNKDGNRALEVSGDSLIQRTAYAERGRFIFQFEPVIYDNTEVVEVTPADGATGVSVNAEIKITFNQNVNALGEPNLNKISISETMDVQASFDEKVITITHRDFKPKTEYTVTIPKGTVVGCDTDTTWTFTTGEAVIEVLEFTPANGLENVSINADVSVTFSKNPYINGEEPRWDLITIKDAVSDIVVTGMGISGNTFLISHKAFDYDTEYIVNIPKETVSGLKAATTWKFKTAKPTGIDNFNANQVTVYPTITSGKVQITTVDKAQIRLCDLTGRTLEVINSTGGICELDLSNRVTGVYFTVINTDEKTITRKIVKR
jgi:hypothetical protein